jgi:hypothetical protein
MWLKIIASRPPSISLRPYQISSKVINGGQTHRHFGMIQVTFNAITIRNFIQIHLSVQKLHPPQKFKRPPFWIDWSYGIKQNAVNVIFNVIISIQNYIQIHQSVQKLHNLRSLNVRHFGVINDTFSVITSIHNFNQIHQSVQTLSGVLFTNLRSLNVRHFGMKLWG